MSNDNPNTSIKFINLNKTRSNTLPADIVSIYIDDKNTRRIAFNKTLTTMIREGGYRFLRVGFNDVCSDAYFVFCREQTPDALLVHLEDEKPLIINSKFLVETLIEKMGLPRRQQLLNVSKNLSNTSEYLTYRLSK